MEFMTSLQSGLDEQKPSLFELLSEQQLAALIPPSLRYLLAVATHRHPRYLLRALNSFDELYALLSFAVERYYLSTYGGGFTENFYGLKRERVLRVRGGEVPRAQLGSPDEVRETLKLRSRDVWRNLAVMVALPYVKRKLDESYDIHAGGINLLGPSYHDRDAYPSGGSVKARLMWLYKWFLRRVYPSVNAAYYFSLLAFNLAYLFDGSKYHSPWLWLIGTRMRRLNEADSRAIAMAAQAATSAAAGAGARPGQTNSLFSRRTLSHTVYPQMLSGLKILLPTSIFALKFLEWWHASDFARQLSRKANEGLELPPPIVSGLAPAAKPRSEGVSDAPAAQPALMRRDSGVATAPLSSVTGLPIFTVKVPSALTAGGDAGDAQPDVEAEAEAEPVCPICLGPIQTPTAAQTGFVYCYTCIYKWVDGTHPRQEAFMAGSGDGDEVWREEDQAAHGGGGSRVGTWESGKGRDAVTGRRVLGETGGLRRVVV